MMKDCCHVKDQISCGSWRYGEERVQIGAAFVKSLEKKNERHSKSLMHIWFCALCICAWCRASVGITGRPVEDLIFAHRKSNFFFLPVSTLTKKVWGRLAAQSWENRCCIGRQSEGSVRRGAEDRTHQAFSAACVRFTARTVARNVPQQRNTRKSLFCICVGRLSASLIPIFEIISACLCFRVFPYTARKV